MSSYCRCKCMSQFTRSRSKSVDHLSSIPADDTYNGHTENNMTTSIQDIPAKFSRLPDLPGLDSVFPSHSSFGIGTSDNYLNWKEYIRLRPSPQLGIVRGYNSKVSLHNEPRQASGRPAQGPYTASSLLTITWWPEESRDAIERGLRALGAQDITQYVLDRIPPLHGLDPFERFLEDESLLRCCVFREQ